MYYDLPDFHVPSIYYMPISHELQIKGHGNKTNYGTWEFTKIMGNGNKINHGTWECSKIMGHGNKVNHGTWECTKIMGHQNVVKSWEMGIR
jgi:hypothetical protein